MNLCINWLKMVTSNFEPPEPIPIYYQQRYTYVYIQSNLGYTNRKGPPKTFVHITQTFVQLRLALSGPSKRAFGRFYSVIYPMGTATWNTRRIHVIHVDYVDVENSTWNTRWIYVKNVHQVDRHFQTSNPRRFHVEIYPAIGKVDFYVESTSILRRKVSMQIWYIFNVDSTLKFSYPEGLSIHQRRIYVDVSPTIFVDFFDVEYTSIQRWNFPIHKECRFINVEYTSIPRQGFPTV